MKYALFAAAVICTPSISLSSDGQGDATFDPNEYVLAENASGDESSASFASSIQSGLEGLAEKFVERAKKAGIRPVVRAPARTLVPVMINDGVITSFAGSLGGGQIELQQRGGSGPIGDKFGTEENILRPMLN